MKGKKVAGLVGDLAPVEAAYSLKTAGGILGGKVECRTDGAKLPVGNRSAYVGTAKIEDIDSAKVILLDRDQPACREPGAERPHPQGLDQWRDGGAVRREGRSDLLGLAIVRRIVEDHNGFIRALPNEPQGTRILVELPVAEADASTSSRTNLAQR
jgi:hypothetical protein